MLGAIYVGLSGLSAYSRGLQQVSNNVANLNSQGFKASTVTFRDLYGGERQDGASYSSERRNPGFGVREGDNQISFKQGDLRQTDRDLDLAVDGSGFLMLMRGSETAYTRTGSFEVNDDGFVVLSGTDYKLAVMDEFGTPTTVSVNSWRSNSPKATTKVSFVNNLSSGASTFTISDLKVLDKTGAEHIWRAVFTRDTNVSGQWSVAVTDDKGVSIGTQTLKFINGVPDPLSSRLDFTDSAAGLTVTFDFSMASSYSGGEVTTLQKGTIDGYGLGALASVSMNDKAELELGYSNGQKKSLGAIALVDFRDPQALEQKSGGMFTDGGDAGRELMSSKDARAGTVMSRRLEASNVDLSKEFGDLILIQRGFQASSQIISVANDMLQQLFGMRGQG